jgi:hypothetical protein
MKLSKMLVLVTTTLAVFGIGHVRGLVTHGQFGCAVAAAQSWDDSSSDDDTAAEPDKEFPPPVGGFWKGEIEDAELGEGDIVMEIEQKGTKLSGDWSSYFGGITFKGSINGDGDLKLNMKSGEGGCHLDAVGQLFDLDAIHMTYQFKSCDGFKKDHGNIDVAREHPRGR